MATQNDNQNQKIIPINIGVIIFVFIFFELLIAIIMYLRTDHVVPYEVKEGSLSSNNIYRAIALRDEDITYCTDSGYVNYYIREGTHAAVNDLIYTVDETGKLAEMSTTSELGNNLSDEDLTHLRAEISNFSAGFHENQFSDCYSFKNIIQSKVVEFSTTSTLMNADNMEHNNSNLVHYNYASNSGVVLYSMDGFEEIHLQDMKSEMFDETQYEEVTVSNDALVGSGDFVYKTCTNEDWNIVIQVEKDMADLLMEKQYVEVRFLKNQNTSWGMVSTYTNEEGETFVQLSFTNSMISFCTERFLNIELLLENEKGLKIPNSSIVEKEFFIVNKAYVSKGGKSGKDGVTRQAYDEEGNLTADFIETSIYSETEDSYYLDDDTLRLGDILLLVPEADRDESILYESVEPTCTIQKTGTLIGVYNINKGYAEFREISILYQNDEYAIVKPNTTYGLSVYDYIILDSTTVDDNQLLYE